ncbi:hypothetical protein MASR2M78_12170 [Treponema sp.]
MARIKSALEIALERTDSVKGDRDSLEQFELKREGKRIGGTFLEDPVEHPIEAELKKHPKDKQPSVRRGAYEVLSAQISLPMVKEDLAKLETVGKGLSVVIGDKKVAVLFQGLLQAMTQYLSDAAQYDKAIQQQFAPKLRQKEEELARRTGRRVQIDPFQDPEFIAFYNQNMGVLKDKYQGAIDQTKEQLAEYFGD